MNGLATILQWLIWLTDGCRKASQLMAKNCLLKNYWEEKQEGIFITRKKSLIKNTSPLISRYGIFKDAGPDMYYKGWAIIHMLREIVNDDAKFKSFLREMNRNFYHQTASSKQIEEFFSSFFNRDYNKFFDQYLRVAAIPVLEYSTRDNRLKYRLVSDVADLEIPIKLKSPGKWIRATTNWRKTKLKKSDLETPFTVDPNFLLEVRNID